MSTFLELLATDSTLAVKIEFTASQPELVKILINGCQHLCHTVVGTQSVATQVPLLDPISIEISGQVTVNSVTVDDFEMWPTFGWQQQDCKKIHVGQPFYRWHHQVTGQGWLLEP